MLFETNLPNNNITEKKKKIHIPFHDVDDLAFKNRHDPNFIASISKHNFIDLCKQDNI
jgi:hypothetical protein